MEQSMAILLLSKLESGEGRNELNKLLKNIRKTGINESNSDIYIFSRDSMDRVDIKLLEWSNPEYLNYINDVKEILQKYKLQPQMIIIQNSYVAIADNDFSYDGPTIKSNNLVHFFRSNDQTNLKLQILIQTDKTGLEADMFIRSNGKIYSDV